MNTAPGSLVRSTALCCLVAGVVAAPAAAQQSSAPCNVISGLPSISFTGDGGATYVPTPRPLTSGTATFGLTALTASSGFVAEYAGAVYRSTSDGCHWARLGTTELTPLRLVAGADEEAWAWSFFSDPGIWRIDTTPGGAGITRRASLPSDVLTLAVDPADGTHLRAVARNGQIYESLDAAGSWLPAGRRAPVGPLAYFAAVNPNDFGSVMIGVISDGVWTTIDDGQSWTKAQGLSATNGSVNGFAGLFAGADPEVAYVMALDLDQLSAPSGGRHIYRSTDRGLTFAPVVDQGNGVTLINGPLMVDRPDDAGVLYFAFGSRFAGGVTLYRFDAATGTTTANLSSIHTGVRALAIDRDRPATVYVGFEGP